MVENSSILFLTYIFSVNIILEEEKPYFLYVLNQISNILTEHVC